MLKMIMTEDERNELVERERELRNKWEEYVVNFYEEKAREIIRYETVRSILWNNGNDYCFSTTNNINECMKCQGFIQNGGYSGYGRRKECFCSSKRKIKECQNDVKRVLKSYPMSFEEYLINGEGLL